MELKVKYTNGHTECEMEGCAECDRGVLRFEVDLKDFDPLLVGADWDDTESIVYSVTSPLIDYAKELLSENERLTEVEAELGEEVLDSAKGVVHLQGQLSAANVQVERLRDALEEWIGIVKPEGAETPDYVWQALAPGVEARDEKPKWQSRTGDPSNYGGG